MCWFRVPTAMKDMRQAGGKLSAVIGFIVTQSEHIGQWATPHHLTHDRRLGRIGRVVPVDCYGTITVKHSAKRQSKTIKRTQSIVTIINIH